MPVEICLPSEPSWKPMLYHVYGLRVASDFPFRGLVPAPTKTGPGNPDLDFRVYAEPWRTHTQDSVLEPDSALPPAGVAALAPGWVYLLSEQGQDVLRYPGLFDFRLDSQQICCYLHCPEARERIEIALFGTVLAFWLERQGRLVLHAAAVALESCAVVFLAPNGGGKTSLALGFALAGASFLSDNLTPVAVSDSASDRALVVYPGLPQVRLWPEQARRFLPEDAVGLPHHVGNEANARREEKYLLPITAWGCPMVSGRFKLHRVYLPSRNHGLKQARVEPIAAAEALRQLQALAFVPTLAEAGGQLVHRFKLLAQIVREVGVYRLLYPEGIERLPAVRDVVRADLAEQDRGRHVAH
jgi:hypothetical protein